MALYNLHTHTRTHARTHTHSLFKAVSMLSDNPQPLSAELSSPPQSSLRELRLVTHIHARTHRHTHEQTHTHLISLSKVIKDIIENSEKFMFGLKG